MQRAFLGIGILITLLAAGLVFYVGASGDFIESLDETLIGVEIGEDERQAVQAMTSLELPMTTLYHAYHFESALDQRMVALISMPDKDVETVLAQPHLADAVWEPASGLPTPTSDLSAWPSSWGVPTAAGRRTSIDAAPGRQLEVSIGENASNTRTLQITWTTY